MIFDRSIGPCSNVRYLGYSKIYVYLLTYFNTRRGQRNK